jgi:hypothetical protein
VSAAEPDWLARWAADRDLPYTTAIRQQTHRSLRYRARLNSERPHRHHPNP